MQSIIFGNRMASINVSKRLPFPKFYRASNNSEAQSTFEFIDDDAIEKQSMDVKRKAPFSKRKYVSLKRRRIMAPISEPKRHVMLSQQNIEETIMKVCCEKLCIRKITKDDCQAIRTCIWSKKGTDRHNYLLQQFSCFLRQSNDKKCENKPRLMPMVNGINICNRGYQWLTGLSHGTYWCIWAEVKDEVIFKFHGNTRKRKPRRSTVDASVVLKQIFEGNALPQPHLQQTMPDGTVLCQHHLPLGMTKKDVLHTVNRALQDKENFTISRSSLYKIWRGEFYNVKTPSKQRMSKCKVCDELKNAIEHSKCDQLREKYLKWREIHLRHVHDARKLYASWREESISNMEKYMCITIDGMDQNTTTLPRFRRTPPPLEGKRGLKTHLCGVLVHGHRLYCDVWIDCLHDHDSNQVATSIMKAIRKVKEAHGTLPRILRIQADNCWRENKNRYIFGMCTMLVALKIFEEVEMGFLLVGHTHEDIDQIFSVISGELKCRDVLTMEDMITRIGKKIGGSRKEESEVAILERMVDWRTFIEPYLKDRDESLVGHTNPHYFKFKIHENTPMMQWKYYSIDGEDLWSKPYALLQKIPTLEETKFLLAKNKALDIEEMKGLHAFILHVRTMAQKYPEQLHKNMEILRSTEALVENLKRQENLPSIEYSESFWPEQSSGTNFVRDVITDNIMKEAEQLLLPRRFCGRKGDKPLPEFVPFDEIEDGVFVAVLAPDPESDLDDQGGPIWIAKVVEISRNEKGIPSTFAALWYEPKPLKNLPKKYTLKQLYEGCLKEKREWVPNKEPLSLHVEVSSIIHCWKSRTRTLKRKHGYDVEKCITIPDMSREHIKYHLNQLNAEPETEKSKSDDSESS